MPPPPPPGPGLPEDNHRLAATVCLTIENTADFHALHRRFIAEHQPATPGEEMLVEELAVARWRLERAWLLESTLFECRMGRDDRSGRARLR